MNEAGELEVSLAHGRLTQKAPYIYQENKGKKIQVQGSFKKLDANSFGFEVAPYDKKRPLVIDPVIEYSGFLGGSFWDSGCAIAIDSEGYAHITGVTPITGVLSGQFPTTMNAFQDLHSGGILDAFYTSLNPSGGLAFSTLIGGSDMTRDWALPWMMIETCTLQV